ncbi:hypothetical protein [Chroococcidiopsis sp.]|uniref:hypothetical protein n=1 Tax=Chroococcidiopsis sp. TaxID=3088168 RepID=UPI003F3BE290
MREQGAGSREQRGRGSRGAIGSNSSHQPLVPLATHYTPHPTPHTLHPILH